MSVSASAGLYTGQMFDKLSNRLFGEMRELPKQRKEIDLKVTWPLVKGELMRVR